MVFEEKEEMEEEEEETPICLYCNPSDYLTVGLSCAFVGALFFATMAFVCIRNSSKPLDSDESAGLVTSLVEADAEGKTSC